MALSLCALTLSLLGSLDAGVAAEAAQPVADRLETLQEQLDRARAELDSVKTRESWLTRLRPHLSGSLDVGAFVVQGNGSGVRQDFDRHLSRFAALPAENVLEGDPLSTAVNARGEPADTGAARGFLNPLGVGGNPSFIVNALTVNLRANVDDDVVLDALMDFLPRPRAGGLADFVDVKRAFVRWQPDWAQGRLTLWAGKVDSTLGIEYRHQESFDRLTVTPSLVCRYICGHPVGVRANARLLDGGLDVTLALTNGTNQVELFPFSSELATTVFKTLSGRVAAHFPVGKGLEVNASGAAGPQPLQPDDGVLQWHAGVAAELEWKDLLATAELVTGRALGKTDAATGVRCAAASCLFYRAAVVQAGWRATTVVTPYLRVDWRAAWMQDGLEWAYDARVLRATVGLRLEPRANVAIKAEYTFNRELGAVEFPDDVFTSSLVMSY